MNISQFQQNGFNFIQMEKTYLTLLQNLWIDEIPSESNPNIDLITQLNHRTVKSVQSLQLNLQIFSLLDSFD